MSTSAVAAAANRTAAQLEQTNELQSCLNQWNDYAPSLIRRFPRKASEERVSAQLRFDYQLTDDLTVYAAYQKADRHVTNVDNTLNLGSPAYNQAGSFTQTAPRGHLERTDHASYGPDWTGRRLLFHRPVRPSHHHRDRHGANDHRLRRGKRHDQCRGR